MSPYTGTDKFTLLEDICSTAKVNQEIHFGGTLLNLRLNSELVATKQGQATLGATIQALFSLGAFHVQFSCIFSDTMRKVQAPPSTDRRGQRPDLEKHSKSSGTGHSLSIPSAAERAADRAALHRFI